TQTNSVQNIYIAWQWFHDGGQRWDGGGLLENTDPLICECARERLVAMSEEDQLVPDSTGMREIFSLIRSIDDPEHPLTLEELNVESMSGFRRATPRSQWPKPSHPPFHTAAWLPLLACPSRPIKVKLLRSLLKHFKMHISPGSHALEHAVKKQLADKERVAAALENTRLLGLVNWCLSPAPEPGFQSPAPPSTHGLIFFNH
ncbi:hypothetical protein HPG69_002392, partial [Diceros bicornis minor]